MLNSDNVRLFPSLALPSPVGSTFTSSDSTKKGDKTAKYNKGTFNTLDSANNIDLPGKPVVIITHEWF